MAKLYGSHAIARAAGVSHTTIIRAIHRDDLPAVCDLVKTKQGRQMAYIVTKGDLRRWMRKRARAR